MAALLLTRPSGRMPWVWVEMLDDYDALKRYNWSKYIRQTTMKSLETEKRQYRGCPLFLLIWLCDNTDIMPCVNARFWPRILKWNLSQLSKLIKQGGIQISSLRGFQWIGSAPVCKYEWEKLDCPEMGVMYVECKHGGDTYLGESEGSENTDDNCEDTENYLCMPEICPAGYHLRTMDANTAVYVKGMTESSFIELSDAIGSQGHVVGSEIKTAPGEPF